MVLPYDPNDEHAWESPVAIIECKVIYLNYGENKRKQYIKRLIEQLSVAHSSNPSRIGFLIGVYTYWPDYRKPKQTFKEFRRNIGHLLCQQAINGVKGFSIKVERGGTMETFLGEKKSKVGAAEVVVGCVAQYIKLVPSDK